MIAKQIISDNLPMLNVHDKIYNVLNMMDTFGVSHLPIVHNGEYLGLVSEEELYQMGDTNQNILPCKSVNMDTFVYDRQHIYDVVSMISRNKQTIVPVVTSSREYLGSIIAFDVLLHLDKLLSAEISGTIVVLALNKIDYSLSQISQIVEYNDSKILSLYTSSKEDSRKMRLTIKIESDNIESILETFNRYEYEVLEVHAAEDKVADTYNDRYDNLMNFLDL